MLALLGAVVLSAGVVGAGGLRVTTDSPDALCPPLEQAREAIHARVGEVAGGPYEARYVLIRSAERAGDSIRLVLTDETGKVLLERTLPVPAGGCADASQAMALILERYFRGVGQAVPRSGPDGAPSEQAPHPNAEAEPKPTAAPRAEPAAPVPRSHVTPPAASPGPSAPEALEEPQGARWLFARGGAGINGDGSPVVAIGAEMALRRWWSLSLDAVFAVASGARRDQNLELDSTTHSLFLESTFVPSAWGRLSLGLGPTIGLQRQAVELVDETTVAEGTPRRWLSSAGGHTALRLDLSKRVRADLLLRAGAQLAGTRFVVLDGNDAEIEVLNLPNLAWDVSLNVGSWF